MKIKTIEIENFRAFYGKHTVEVNGKNMLIYGENGSGKSSLYWAVHDFFRSAYKLEDIEFKKNEWNLLDSSPQQSKINITFDEYDKPFSFTPSEPTPQEPKFINQVGKQNPFFTYRRLLKTYIEDNNIEKRIFDLLVNDILGNIQSNDNITLRW